MNSDISTLADISNTFEFTLLSWRRSCVWISNLCTKLLIWNFKPNETTESYVLIRRTPAVWACHCSVISFDLLSVGTNSVVLSWVQLTVSQKCSALCKLKDRTKKDILYFYFLSFIFSNFDGKEFKRETHYSTTVNILIARLDLIEHIAL